MKNLLLLLFCVQFHWVSAQLLSKTREIYVNEKDLAQLAFIQADFDQDGKIDFLTDANKQQNFFIGRVEEQDILTLMQGPYFSINYDLLDVRYEDPDKDGENELYAFDRNEGLIRYSLPGMTPVQTFSSFKEFTSFQKLILADINNDAVNEWILLDEFDGIAIISIENGEVITSYSSFTGSDMLIENIDSDNNLEIILRTNNSILVIDGQTFAIEHTIPLNYVDKIKLADLDHDGLTELIIMKGETLRIYHHESKAIIDSFTVNLFSGIRDFVVFNIDADATQEILGYTESFSKVIEFNIFPLRVTGQYDIQETRDLGRFIDYSKSDPDELVFSFGNLGLAFLNPVSKKVRFTYQTGAPHALLVDRLGKGDEEYLITRPSGSFNPVLNIKSLDTFKTFKQINKTDVFITNNSSLGSSIFTFAQKGLSNRLLFFEDDYSLSFYNFHTHLHNEFNRYHFSKLHMDDLDYDGSKELIMDNNNVLDVYRISGDFNFELLYSTIPVAGNFLVAQTDQTLTKEIITYFNNDVVILDGMDGSLIRQLDDMTIGSIGDLKFYTNGNGNFYLVLVDATKVYIYDYTNNAPVKDFDYTTNPNQGGLVEVVQINASGTLQNFITVFNNLFKLYSTNGNLLFTDNTVRSTYNDKGKIVVSDYDRDLKPDIIISSPDKFTEYSFTGPGNFYQSFYMTDIFPEDGSVYKHNSPILLQFSEMVDLASVTDNITIISSREGVLNYTIEVSGEQQITLHHSPLEFGPDNVTIEISGGLKSTLSKFLDTNYDDLSLSTKEQPIVISYIFNPAMTPNTVEITSIDLLPEKLYTQTKRHLTLNISSEGQHRTAIHSIGYGVYSPQIQALGTRLPVDSVFDEVSEEVKIPINTFDLPAGDYTFYIVAYDLQGNSSDTFFYSFTLVDEPGNYHKNTGGDFYRTSVISNNAITTNLKKIGELSHGTYDYISPVAGGEGQMIYLERLTPGNNGIIHNLQLSTLEPIWEKEHPIYVLPGSPHLDNGILYFSNAEDAASEAYMMAFDMHTGEEISKKQFSSNGFYASSPITNEQYIAMSGGQGTYLFDRWTNQELWYVKGSGFNHRESNPAIYDNKVFRIDNKLIQAIDVKSGKVVWKVELEEENSASIANAVLDTLNSNLLWIGEGNIFAFDLETGNLKWKRFTGTNRENPVVYKNEIYLFISDFVKVHDATTGNFKRQKNVGGFTWSQPVISNGKLFLPLNGRFEIYEAQSMSKVWTENITVDEISIIDEYLILTAGKTIHVYQSKDQCCNSTIEWTEAIYHMQGGGATSRRFTFDSIPTLLNGKIYFEILISLHEHGGGWERTFRYIRHEDSKIYEGFASEERLLMDFNLNLNDTILYYGYAEAVVEAIDFITLENGEVRKQLELHCDVGGDVVFYWIEGVGSSAGLFWGDGMCAADGGSALLCQWQDGELIYDNPDVNSCWLLVSTSELEQNFISYSPNPVLDHLTLQDPDQKISNVAIYDMFGHLIYTGNELTIDMTHLPAGSYSLHVRLADGKQVSERIVKL